MKKKVKHSPFATSPVKDVFAFAVIILVILMTFSAFALAMSSNP